MVASWGDCCPLAQPPLQPSAISKQGGGTDPGGSAIVAIGSHRSLQLSSAEKANA
ncbi:hypothetical protein BO83DRAFT_374712 [Aspergillus eucalypticola CBS 122712]|uniref:Uncharacterized protein n=1 Tax=Aspergillus eucalypticola (strain CBS 122712 / IBT 29274) TaxID=1448314 RepID=A0A317WD90_ASPEC|nr:uncharacterized protein BO83DRAFT_374712 [Aspergillus eucalypticola CBS 122712]PWY84333.1 hypothetical protein BO83DRAFT_374712 [Aspergillus eucalypticola CBS 122712]